MSSLTSPRSVLIAGYSAGFGAALARHFEAAGYTVIKASRSGDGEQLDLTDETAVHQWFSCLDRDYPPLAGVIHNVMAFLREPLLSTTAAQLESVWRASVMSAFLLTREAVPRLESQGGGTLIYSGASGSRRAGPGFAAFSSAKFALRGFAQAVAREHGARGIHAVSVIIDGLIASDKTAARFPGSDPQRMINPDDLAAQYLELFRQPASVWTQELDIRPMGGSF
ncbi:SDR family NAD(P)-dependent oxidoreductase [Silvimonas iriomotensis]|uniref:Short-chain dehydrogenase n=1 Tax=Silvimonas iriomotensis TaxID=449662 RepID=A0ABQ2P777_9NEIS|nr:SDR family NAD(P)-dependent oxidoreductase [Silvimonas iriomotensis]GGP19689.1 short-chain dehydrogenase [Silvimonas iriomotensis]